MATQIRRGIRINSTPTEPRCVCSSVASSPIAPKDLITITLSEDLGTRIAHTSIRILPAEARAIAQHLLIHVLPPIERATMTT